MAVTPELNDYIQKARVAGMSDDAIRTELLKSGWNVADVNVAIPPRMPNINSQQPPPVSVSQPVVVSKHSSHLSLIITIGLLICLGTAAYVFYPQITGFVLGLTGTQTPIAPVQTEPAATIPQNQINVSSTEPIATSTEGWQTYRNDKYGFEFQYPKGFITGEGKISSG